MMNDVQQMIQRATTGEIDSPSVSQAANDHVQSMDEPELTNHLQTAADNAQQNGQPDLAQQIVGIVEQNQGNPSGLKSEVVSLVTNNPQILQQFAPEFAKDILSRI